MRARLENYKGSDAVRKHQPQAESEKS